MFVRPRGGKAASTQGGGGKATVRKPARSQVEINAAHRARDRAKLLKTIEEFGPTPAEGSTCFTLFNKQFYNIDVRQLVSCKVVPGATGDVEAAESHRQKRRLLVINAGGRTLAPHTDAEWTWPMLRSEERDLVWLPPAIPPPAGDKKPARPPHPLDRDPMRVCDPNVDFAVGDEPMHSHADVLARYMGHKALCTPSTTAFTNYLLNMDADLVTGKPVLADMDKDAPLWDEQRARLRTELGKIYLLHPRRVGPCLDEHGRAFAEGEVEAAHAEERDPVPLPRPPEADGARGQAEAPQPVVFASILSDKRPDKLGLNIAKWHDKLRAWMLPPSHVEQIKRVVWHYKLETDFPALAHLHPKRSTALLDLEAHRQAAFEAIGPAPEAGIGDEALVCPAWLAARAAAPFGNVWVQHCDRQNPTGALEFGTFKPSLVALRKGRAEERNGVPWLDVEEIDRRTAEGEQHYVDIQTALHSRLGKAWSRAGQKRKAAEDLATSAADSASRDAGSAKKLAKLQSKHDWALARIAELESKANAKHLVLHDTGSAPGVVDFLDGADAKCLLRWNRGALRIDRGKGLDPIDVCGSAGTLKVRFLADEEDAPLPELDFVAESEDEGEGEEDDE